jgi:hypothetical protein
MGGETAPVASSGSAPAWTARVAGVGVSNGVGGLVAHAGDHLTAGRGRADGPRPAVVGQVLGSTVDPSVTTPAGAAAS